MTADPVPAPSMKPPVSGPIARAPQAA